MTKTYGRAVVAGNQADSFVGALTPLELPVYDPRLTPIAILTSIYVAHAELFSYLMFGSSGID